MTSENANEDRNMDTVELPKLDDLHAKHFGPRPPPIRVEFGALSHPGRVRPNNEDHYLVVERRRSRSVLLTNLPDGFLAPDDDTGYVMAVADGLGGPAFGEVASMLVLRSGWELSPSTIKWSWIITDREVEELKERLELTFRRMDQDLREWARAEPEYTGMATTLTGAYTVGPEAFIAHVGDSRAYLYHQGVLTQLTRDHTVAQEYLDQGLPVLCRSWHHVLTNCLGGNTDLHVEFHHFQLTDGDCMLLCSDGLTGQIRHGEIAALLGRQTHPQETAQALIDLALERGGKDNITVVLARYAVPPPTIE